MRSDNPDFYLMSTSPRRKVLLQQLGTCFDIITTGIDETAYPKELPQAYVKRMAREKAKAGWKYLQQTDKPWLPVLSADTSVVVEGKILGKPRNKVHGLSMLAMLSDNTHDVMTAVAIVFGNTLHECISITQVSFGKIDKQAAERYWDTKEPCDKAGAYAIQGFGAAFVKNIKGSYSNVVGLPLWETTQLFRKLNIPYWNKN